MSKTYIFNILLENGFSYRAAKQEMGFEAEIIDTISEEWKAWLNENISMGQNKDGLFKVLLMHGFSFDAIKAEMKYEPLIPLDQLEDPLKTSSFFEINNIVTQNKTTNK